MSCERKGKLQYVSVDTVYTAKGTLCTILICGGLKQRWNSLQLCRHVAHTMYSAHDEKSMHACTYACTHLEIGICVHVNTSVCVCVCGYALALPHMYIIIIIVRI